MLKTLKMLVSPAALCAWAICACIAFSVAGSYASRTITLKQETKFGWAQAAFPLHMKRWDEELFANLTARTSAEMSEFLKTAEQDAAAKPEAQEDGTWKPYSQSSRFAEQFRTLRYVSYLQAIESAQEGGEASMTFRTVNFDKLHKHELFLGDILEGASDKSKALEALSAYARADLKDKTGEEEEEESEALLDLSKPDLAVYERFTLCPSTQMGKAAGLTIHFPPAASGPYAGSEFHVVIPYTVFAKFLKPSVKGLFAGEPRPAPIAFEDNAS